VRDSGAYAADVFRVIAAEAGITLPEPTEIAQMPSQPAPILGSLPSSTLADISQGMLRFSTNLTAEVLGLSATASRLGAPPSGLEESAALMTGWAQGALGMEGSRFADHSGLSSESQTTANNLSEAMLTLGYDGPLRPLLRRYALSDDAGRRVPMELQAKTGTLNFVSALAGYITPEDGPPMVFAILTADLDRRAAIPPGDEENPPGNRGWVRRSRKLQFDLARLWGRHAATDPDLI
jgi:D-alanyl-D-alanine carboxypeptidase/D-alanyl-D-alanine-endopeptidase (penicillin-binding protein 4)